MKKVLVIAPHMDDETIGTGGTICRHVEAKDDVKVCFVCNRAYGHKYIKKLIDEQKRNALKAQKVLGYQEKVFLDLDDEKLDARLIDLIVPLEKAIVSYKPNIVYLPHRGDNNQDHRAVFDAAMVALRSFANSYTQEIYTYESPSSTEQAAFSRENTFVPNSYVDIERFIEKKKKALNCYQKEKRKFPHPRSQEAIEALAIKRGVEVYLRYAEAFEAIRVIKK